MITRRALLGSAIGVAAGATVMASAADAKTFIDGTHRPLGPAALIGDSLTAGFIPGLIKEFKGHGLGPFRLQIRGGRAMNKVRKPFDSGAVVLNWLHKQGYDAPVWVIALGGNDFPDIRSGRLVAQDEIKKVLDIIGDHPVAWPTVWHRRSPSTSDQFNAALDEVALERPNLHVVDSWAPLVKEHQATWFLRDGVHLKGGALKARNLMLADAAALAALSLLPPEPPPQQLLTYQRP